MIKQMIYESMCSLQEWLSGLTDTTFDDTLHRITESMFAQEKYQNLLIQDIFDLYPKMQKKQDIIINLIIELINSAHIKQKLIDYGFHQISTGRYIEFLGKQSLIATLRRRDVISYNDIQPKLAYIIVRSNKPRELGALLLHAEDLCAGDKDLYIQLISKLSIFSAHISSKSHYFTIMQNINQLKMGNYQFIKGEFATGCKRRSLEHVLKFDEIDKIKSMKFDINKNVKTSSFEVCTLARKNPTPICYAALFGSVECFKYLKEKGASLNGIEEYAVAGGCPEIIAELNGNHDFTQCLPVAVQYRHDLVCQWLSTSIKDADNKSVILAAISEAARSGNILQLSKLLELINYQIGSAISQLASEASAGGHLIVLQYLMECEKLEKLDHLDLSNCFVRAAITNRLDVVKYLLPFGVDVNTKYDGKTALIAAAEENFGPLMEILLENGADMEMENTEHQRALYLAALYDSTECCNMLLDKGADPRATPTPRESLAVAAASNCNIELLKKIIDKGIDPIPALFVAAEIELPEVLNMLLNLPGVSANDVDGLGQTPLHIACTAGVTENVKTLIKAGADVNARDTVDGTPLHYAAGGGHIDSVKVLLADPRIDREPVDAGGRTPTRLAEMINCQVVIDLLNGNSSQ